MTLFVRKYYACTMMFLFYSARLLQIGTSHILALLINSTEAGNLLRGKIGTSRSKWYDAEWNRNYHVNLQTWKQPKLYPLWIVEWIDLSASNENASIIDQHGLWCMHFNLKKLCQDTLFRELGAGMGGMWCVVLGLLIISNNLFWDLISD
jgi:hypothetical protein